MFKLSSDMFCNFFACRKRKLELKVLSALYHTPNFARRAGLNNALWSPHPTPCFERLVARPCIEKLITAYRLGTISRLRLKNLRSEIKQYLIILASRVNLKVLIMKIS